MYFKVLDNIVSSINVSNNDECQSSQLEELGIRINDVELPQLSLKQVLGKWKYVLPTAPNDIDNIYRHC